MYFFDFVPAEVSFNFNSPAEIHRVIKREIELELLLSRPNLFLRLELEAPLPFMYMMHACK